MDLFSDINVADIISLIVYAFISFGLFGLFWWIITLVAPISIIRELEEDNNIAVAVLIGSIFLSMAIIIAAVILS